MKKRLEKAFKNPIYRALVVITWLYAMWFSSGHSLPLWTYIEHTLLAVSFLGEPLSNILDVPMWVISSTTYMVYLPSVAGLEWLKIYKKNKK